MRLGQFIKNYRNEHGISMDEFARRSGISKQYVSRLEMNSHPTTKKMICPSLETIKKAAIGMSMDFTSLINMLDEKVTILEGESEIMVSMVYPSIRIPILGKVAAGEPIDAIEDVLDYIEIPESMTKHGEFFGLKIKGNSMEPRMYDGDTVIVLSSDTAENGDIIIASINEDEALCKKYIKKGNKQLLHSLNPDYKDIDVTNDESFRIIGVVVELRVAIKSL